MTRIIPVNICPVGTKADINSSLLLAPADADSMIRDNSIGPRKKCRSLRVVTIEAWVPLAVDLKTNLFRDVVQIIYN